MFRINRSLLPIKAHYFFFMAAMGPILPQINVFGKQLGISADIMGFIMSILPFMYILAKPAVGYLIDYFTNIRKIIFMLILLIMTLCYAGFYFVPAVTEHKVPKETVYNFSMDTVEGCRHLSQITTHESLCYDYKPVTCHISCSHAGTEDQYHEGYLTTYKRIFKTQFDETNSSSTILSTTTTTTTAAVTNSNNTTITTKLDTSKNINYDLCLSDQHLQLIGNNTCFVSCEISKITHQPDCLVGTSTFWLFVVLMCIGTIGFNVANCVSDATCFDMLGDKAMKYGEQRVWGTIGFGLSALISGFVVNAYGADETIKSIAPALIIMLIFSCFDVISIKWIKLPALSSATSIWKEVGILLKQPSIVIFLVFATFAGIIDSFIIYYMFWHLEDIADQSNYSSSIKLIEGCVVAAECLGGEILFFLISGKILKKIGYIHCLSFCFFMYSIRLFLISLITNPWWLVGIEFFMQGPTYALCYTCIVAYASAVSPPGTTATVQGLVAGMDDGLGFAIGSLLGGQAFHRFGGSLSFRGFSIGALIICICHILLRPTRIKIAETNKFDNGEDKKTFNADGVRYVPPTEQHSVELK